MHSAIHVNLSILLTTKHQRQPAARQITTTLPSYQNDVAIQIPHDQMSPVLAERDSEITQPLPVGSHIGKMMFQMIKSLSKINRLVCSEVLLELGALALAQVSFPPLSKAKNSEFGEITTDHTSQNLCLQIVLLEQTLESPLYFKEIKPVNPKGNQPEYSLEGLILKLKLQYFGQLMGRIDSLEETLMLGKIEGRRRRG